ncbi:MAG: serine O-acetyltransferase EpsC [Polyangiaceae bacterium]|nr:serine O-acetyltransferase EpsC [Polyangiaceae bacterium]
MPNIPPTRIEELEDAIDAVVDSYSGPQEINNLESAALPNKRAVITALNHLKPIIYIGFYSQRSLNPHNLRFAISEHVYPAYEILTGQINRAVTYEKRAHRDAKPDCEDFSQSVVLRLFNRLPELRRILNADLLAAYEGDPAARSVEEVVFSYPAIEALTCHRIGHILFQEGVPMIPRIISEYAHSATGIDIHPGAKIGEGFFLDHGTGVVIGETCEIGTNVKVYQGVTLGAISTKRSDHPNGLARKRHPTLENDVTIYSGATILGGDTVIGAGSVIGGNVWLTKSVPPGSKIFGKAKE